MPQAPQAKIDLEQLLSARGPLAEVLADRAGPDFAFEARPEQVRMSAAVARTMASRGRLLVEAGTGVGKSFAYLLPAVQRIVDHGERVVIATNTIALQEQLLEKDVPVIRAALNALGRDFKPILVKGRGNYLSIRRLQMASERQDSLFPDAATRRSLHVIEDWAYTTTDGTLSTLPPLERPAVWERAQSDSGNCMGKRCPTYDKCFYQSARREMEESNLLICNHALFFSDLALRAAGLGFLPRYDHVVLDEAHNVEDVAGEHFGRGLGEGRIRRLLTTLHHQRTGKGFLPQVSVTDEGVDAAHNAIRAVAEAEEVTRTFFDRLLAMAGGSVNETVRLPNAQGGRPPVEDLISPTFADLALRLRRLREVVVREDDMYELGAYAERALAIADDASTLCSQSLPGCVYWIETGASGGAEESSGPMRVRITLACAPIEVGDLLRERLFTEGRSVVLTSATLATGAGREEDASDPFAHARARLGCDDEATDTLLLGSPFDHAAQVEVYVDRAMPDPRSPEYVGRLAERVVEHVRATKGGAFVLFTSFDTLRRTLDLARPALEREGMQVLAQDRDGPRGLLLQKFRAREDSVLFGAASFWQGVDVRGSALRNIVITRLPFEPPDRPLTQARLERIEERGGNPFQEDSLPRAILRFKQGFGRLIRSHSDTGRVVVLDPRIATKPYGRAFLRALPEGVKVHS